MVRVRFWAPPLAGILAGEKTAEGDLGRVGAISGSHLEGEAGGVAGYDGLGLVAAQIEGEVEGSDGDGNRRGAGGSEEVGVAGVGGRERVGDAGREG